MAPQVAPDEAAGIPEVVVVDRSGLAQELDAAIAAARRSAGEARVRWAQDQRRSLTLAVPKASATPATPATPAIPEIPGTAAAPADHPVRWSIKWAAPVLQGDGVGQVEHVWVRPERWTAHRVEGVLLSEPRRDIGYRTGEIVGFPVSELSDWVREEAGRRDGGFTTEVLLRSARRGS